MITYAFVATRDGKIVSSEMVRKQRFMYTALGHWPGLVNPNRENLFFKNNVDSCYLVEDEDGRIVDYYCPIFDSLWKVRFYEHPITYDSYGWSHGRYKPSMKQLEYLHKEYGIQNILTDYIYGENLYKLLRDIRQTSWIVNYKALAKDSLANGP